jgi:hypothetical protein
MSRVAAIRTANASPSLQPLAAHNAVLLLQGLAMLERLTDDDYAVVGPHVRHCLDFYGAILAGTLTGVVEHHRRTRDPHVETSRERAMAVIRETMTRLRFLSGAVDDPLLVRVDHDPSLAVTSTLGRELESAASHTIHHYAVIALLLRARGIATPGDFGVAPSTLRHREGA